MSSENTLTGRGGTVTVAGSPVARITQWAVNPKMASSSAWGDSDSAGFTNRAAGRKDCTFTAEGKYDSSNAVYDLFDPGDIAAVVLGTTGTPGWTFPRALCEDFNLTVNVDSEEILGWTSSWGADGTYSNT